MIYIPPRETKRLVQTNRSNVLGNVWSSYNLDTQDNLGTIRVSPRLKLNTNGLDGCPWGFRYFDTKIWAGAGTLIYGGGSDPSQAFSADSSTGFQSDYSSDESDMEVFNATLVATTTDALYSKASDGSGTGAWTSRDTLSTGGQHVMAYFKKFDRLYYSNQSDNIISIDTSWSTADPGSNYALSLSADSSAYTITSIKTTSDSVWIGILDKTKEGATGRIVEWDGLSTQILNEFPLHAQGCLAILIDKERDTPFAIDSNGVLLRFNGGGFSEVGRLPISNKLLQAMNDVDNERFIHPNGLQFSREGTILAFVNNLNSDSTVNENFQAGVYEFTPQADGTYDCKHKSSPSYTTASTITDYGQSRLSRVGALAPMNVYSTSANRNGTYLLGATYYTDATSTSNGIFYDDSNNTLQKAGYFVTTWISASGIKDTWQKVVAKYRRFLDSSDKVIIKYRTLEESATELTITWASTTSFTTSTNIVGKEGYELEIVNGVGAGICTHLVTTGYNASNYIATVDETVSGATGTAKARLQKWNKLSTANDQTSEHKLFNIGKTSERIQIKCWMLFEGNDELFHLIIDNKEHTPLT